MKDNKNNYLPAGDGFDYTRFPFYWVARLEALYALEMEKTLKKIGMNASRWRVCLLLRAHEELSISDSAQRALGKIPTITKMVYLMEREGLVNVQISTTDARVRMVSLTAEGSQKVADALKTTNPLFKATFDGLSDSDIEVLNHLMRRLFDNLENYDHLNDCLDGLEAETL